MKLVVLKSNEKARHEWTLSKNKIYILGRKSQDEHQPEIDFYFDRRVSRKHAKIWYEHKCWWVEDLGSKHGTVINTVDNPGSEKEIKGTGKACLRPGDEITVGDTVLLFIPASCIRASTEEFTVEVDAAASINYSLIHSGLPAIHEISVRNDSAKITGAARIDVNIEGLARSDNLVIPPLEPGQVFKFQNPHLHIDLPGLEFQVERRNTRMVIFIDSIKVIECDLWVLAFDEWSQEKKHWLSIASFVLPNHPLVKEVVTESRSFLADLTGREFDSFEGLLQSAQENKEELALQAIYNYLKTKWHLQYSYEPPCFEKYSQKVRLPHDILSDNGNRRGQGTCIDLSALLAGCLEHIGFQPLLIMVSLDDQWQHALAGCWRGLYNRKEPLIRNKEMVLQGAVLVESTGCAVNNCGGANDKKDFYKACAEARDCLEECGMIFTVDIAAARGEPYKITPLPFAGEPKPDPVVMDVLNRSVDYSHKFKLDQIGTVNLLLAMAELEGGLTQRVMEALKINSREAAEKLVARMINLSGGKGAVNSRKTIHFDQVVASAAAMAKRDGSPLVLEVYLLISFLETQSQAADKALKSIGADRERFKDALRQVYSEAGRKLPFYSEYSHFFSWVQ